jgi:hypothetical protein
MDCAGASGGGHGWYNYYYYYYWPCLAHGIEGRVVHNDSPGEIQRQILVSVVNSSSYHHRTRLQENNMYHDCAGYCQ